LKLKNKDLLKDGYYKNDIQISASDVRDLNSSPFSDAIITSPPYGDNITTVPYGQHSYLPLQWIDFSDIDKSLNKDIWLRTTHEIDYRSLGGQKKTLENKKSEIIYKSLYLERFLKKLCYMPKDRTDKVITFFYDLDQCIEPILGSLNNGGIMVWVLGNRRVGGIQVPLDKILSDLFKKRNADIFCELTRKIPSKRMAVKNNISETMSNEVILLMRKG
jgi:hypothetical protein